MMPRSEPMVRPTDVVSSTSTNNARTGAWFRAGGVELHLGVEADFRPLAADAE